jgi:hypothetical protein
MRETETQVLTSSPSHFYIISTPLASLRYLSIGEVETDALILSLSQVLSYSYFLISIVSLSDGGY